MRIPDRVRQDRPDRHPCGAGRRVHRAGYHYAEKGRDRGQRPAACSDGEDRGFRVDRPLRGERGTDFAEPLPRDEHLAGRDDRGSPAPGAERRKADRKREERRSGAGGLLSVGVRGEEREGGRVTVVFAVVIKWEIELKEECS